MEKMIGFFSNEFNDFNLNEKFRYIDIDPDKKNCLTIGCSFTWGKGINYNQSFSHMFCEYFKYNNLNYSYPGVSNDYISRSLISNFNDDIDCVLILFTYFSRRELLFDKQYHRIRWNYKNKMYNYKLSDNLTDLYNFQKNYILVKTFLENRNVKYLYGLIENDGYIINDTHCSFNNIEYLDYSGDSENHPGIMTHESIFLNFKNTYENLYENI